MKLIIRKSIPDDVYGIRKVQKITWLDTYPNNKEGITLEDIESRFKDDDTLEGKKKIEERKERYKDESKQTWVAEKSGKIIGFCWAGNEEGKDRVLAIYILPKYQSKGIGSRLLIKAFKYLSNSKTIYINVVEYNLNAIKFYKSHGFVETGKRGVFDSAATLPSGKTLPEIELIKSVESGNMKDKKYQETIKVYEKLGKGYVNYVEPYTPKEFYDFIKLLPQNGRVLDVGCCGGRDSKKFIEKGFKVIGIDLTNSFLKEARKRVPEAKFIKMDLRYLKFPKNYFDAIWAQAVLLHLEKKDMTKALKGFYRVLKDNGKIHIRVKKGRGIYYNKEKLLGKERRLFTCFLKKELEDFVKKVGFKIISSRFFPDDAGRKGVKWICIWAEKAK